MKSSGRKGNSIFMTPLRVKNDAILVKSERNMWSRRLGSDLIRLDFLLGQWLNFKLFGITYLVGKISRSNGFFFRVHWLSENWMVNWGPKWCFFLFTENGGTKSRV